MKKKNRKIIINDKVYLYNVQSRYCGNDLGIVTLKIFLDGYIQTPYIFHFKNIVDFIGGTPLYTGVFLLNKQTALQEFVSLHRPYFARLFILYALSEGWDATKKYENQKAMDVLTHFNLDVSKIEYKSIDESGNDSNP